MILSKLEFMTCENKYLKNEVHLFKSELNLLTRQVKTSKNLQNISFDALEATNKEKTKLKAQVEVAD